MSDRGVNGKRPIIQAPQPRTGGEKIERIRQDAARQSRFDKELDKAWREWETTFDAIQDPVILLDNEFCIVQANAAAARFLGTPIEQIIGEKCYRLIDQADAPADVCPLKKVKETKKRQKTDRHWPQKGAWTVVSVDPIIDGGGDMTGAALIIRDITERKRAENALRESEENFKDVFANALVGLYRTTPDGRILMANPALQRMLGYASFEELAERNLEEEGFEPGYPRSIFKERIEADDRVVGLESVWTKRDGTKLYVRESARAIRDAQGNTLYYEGMVEDITERKKAEEAYKALVEHSLQGLVIFQDGRVVFTNKAMATITGYSVDEMLALSPEKVRASVHPDDQQIVWGRHKQRLTGSQVPEHYECRGVRKDAEVCWLEVHASLVEYQSKPAIQAAFLDITERKKAEDQSLRQAKLLEAVNRVLREALTCDTDTEVAQTCLSMAEQLTGSRFGFIGEVNKAGLFDAIALSDPGWKSCRIPHKEATRSISNMRIRGIWGLVLREEKSQIINEPAAHPDSVGTPEGHPEITCFLGVPLKQMGKTIGMIALANKPSGYNMEDRKDIEALSVAFAEALMRKRATQALLDYQKRLKTLTSELALAEERERRRIAVGIHDDIGQKLALAKLELQSLTLSAINAETSAAVNGACAKIDMAIEDAHSLTFELSNPALYELSFDAAIEQWLLEQIQKKHGIKCHVVAHTEPVELGPDLKVMLFRAIRELAVNVVKYAEAATLRVNIKKGKNNVMVSVKDDGKGFALSEAGAFVLDEKGGFGLFNIRERLEHLGGGIRIRSTPGKGTRVTLTAPLKMEKTEVKETAK